jgi:hypothetical protein
VKLIFYPDRREFPNMRSIQVFGKEVTGWQVFPADASDFEEAALRACELVVARDPRIGKVPGARRSSGLGAKKAPKPSKRARHLREPPRVVSRRGYTEGKRIAEVVPTVWREP